MRRRLTWPAAVLAAVLAGCGGGGGSDPARSGEGVPGLAPQPTPGAAQAAPSPSAAQAAATGLAVTKNTSRVGGANPVANAAAVARAVYPSRAPDLRPAVVSVADAGDWRGAISAAQLMARPLRAPVLLSRGGKLPGATRAALTALAPTGAREARGVRLVRVGRDVPGAAGLRSVTAGGDPAEAAAAVDALAARAAGGRSEAVIVAGAGTPAYAMPAAGLAAKTGAPVLWVDAKGVPAATRAAIRERRRPRIYVIGPGSAVSETVLRELRRLGTTTRIDGEDPIANAVAVARYGDGGFGWKVVDPGHGLVFAADTDPADAGAAAALSGAGVFGPLLLVDERNALPKPVEQYLLDIQPGYDADPVRGVYNHGWIVGGEDSISAPVQARIDGLLEIQPVRR